MLPYVRVLYPDEVVSTRSFLHSYFLCGSRMAVTQAELTDWPPQAPDMNLYLEYTE
jgi:hypothetical protein